jgi:hypothetical protein
MEAAGKTSCFARPGEHVPSAAVTASCDRETTSRCVMRDSMVTAGMIHAGMMQSP